jgi:microsomal dipeptidase-like Zn-dependent dipeptidase
VGRALATLVVVAEASAQLAAAHAATTRPPVLATRCFVLATRDGRFVRAVPTGYRADARRRRAVPFFLKPTAIGRYLLYDAGRRVATAGGGGAVTRASAAGPAAEWAARRPTSRTIALRATATKRALAIDRRTHALVTTAARAARFRLKRGHRCRRFPEAQLDAAGKPFRGKRRGGRLLGFADPHLHVTADLRGGGQVISGSAFDRFGIAQALGHDADVHGADGSLDVTGNLLRSGSPAGTHDTHGWPSFTGWPTNDTYTHQQIYYRWLERTWLAGMRLTVAQTVEDQPLCEIEPRRSHTCDETASIELQVRRLKALQRYVDAQSGGRGRGWFRLVYRPRQARRAITRGKLAVLIGIESSNPFGCSERLGQPQCVRADIDRGIAHMWRLGVRTMFVAHWVDNALAGAALEEGDKGTFISAMQVQQTGQPFVTGACPHPEQGAPNDLTGKRECNTRGLTALGAYAINRMIDRHMLIEVDHLSERAREQVLAIAAKRHYPLVSSHTGTGGLWTGGELRRLYAGGGFASATIDDAGKLPAKILRMRRYSSGRYPGVGIGTDTGGFNALPGPDKNSRIQYPFRPYECSLQLGRQRTGTRRFDLRRDGVAHYGLLPDLLADVQRRKNGRRALALLYRSADGYVRTWRRAFAR